MASQGKVYINGRLIGFHKDPRQLTRDLIQQRRKGKIEYQVNIAFHEDTQEVYINTDAGRVQRPVLVVENGKLKLKEEQLKQLNEGKINWDNLVNKIYLVGGDVSGVKYKQTAEAVDSQSLYYLSEQIINNSSIITDTVADQYLGAILSEKSNPVYSIRAKIENTDLRLEDTVPIGLVSFYDVNYDQSTLGNIVGETADGGSDLTVGLLADGGSDVVIGGSYTAQVNRISYSLSNTDGRFNIKIQLGDTVLETAAKIKKLELALSSLTQY